MAAIPIEEKKAQTLMELRHYKLKKREVHEEIVSLFVRTPRKRKTVLIWCITNKTVVGVAYVRNLEKTLETGIAEKGIIVAKSRYTYAAKRDAKKYGIELIPRIFPSFNLFKHKLVPKHEVLPPEEAKTVFEEYSVEPYQLPRINASDIAAIAIGAKPGDVLKITRASITAGKYVSYRYVIDG